MNQAKIPQPKRKKKCRMIYLACTFLACIDNMMTITRKIAFKNYALFVFANYAMYLIKECNKQDIALELQTILSLLAYCTVLKF